MRYAGKDLTTRFKSVRDAIAYSMSMLKGPQRRRPRWDDSPRVHGSPEAASAVRAIIVGDLGIAYGSPMWKAIEAVVFDGAPEVGDVRKAMRAIRAELGRVGLLDDQTPEETVRLDLEDVTFVDETGLEIKTVREVRGRAT